MIKAPLSILHERNKLAMMAHRWHAEVSQLAPCRGFPVAVYYEFLVLPIRDRPKHCAPSFNHRDNFM